jgi:hypothetical protein
VTIRELILQILLAIRDTLNETFFFFEDVERKIEEGQFLELTVNQVLIIALLLFAFYGVFYFVLNIIVELCDKIEKKLPKIFGENVSHVDWMKRATIFFSTILFALWSYTLYGRPWEQVSTRMLIAVPIFIGCMWGGYFLYRWFFLKIITKYIKSPHEEENKEG